MELLAAAGTLSPRGRDQATCFSTGLRLRGFRVTWKYSESKCRALCPRRRPRRCPRGLRGGGHPCPIPAGAAADRPAPSVRSQSVGPGPEGRWHQPGTPFGPGAQSRPFHPGAVAADPRRPRSRAGGAGPPAQHGTGGVVMGRPSLSRQLAVWMNGERVGRWSVPGRGPQEFHYDPALLSSPQFRPLSLSLPVGLGTPALRGEVVEQWFANLLPDNEAILRSRPPAAGSGGRTTAGRHGRRRRGTAPLDRRSPGENSPALASEPVVPAAWQHAYHPSVQVADGPGGQRPDRLLQLGGERVALWPDPGGLRPADGRQHAVQLGWPALSDRGAL